MTCVLVIDDDAAVRDAMVFLLQTHGYEVIAAADGEKGIAAADEAAVDIAIVDRYMPHMDGIAVVKSLRAKRPHLPIIVMSGAGLDDFSADPDSPSIAPQFGEIKSLPKPIRPSKLISAIEELIADDDQPA